MENVDITEMKITVENNSLGFRFVFFLTNFTLS